MNASDVPAATALLDVRPRDFLAEGVFERFEKVRLRMAVVALSDEIDVIPGGGVFDRLLGLFDYEVAALGVLGLFEGDRPRVVPNAFGSHLSN